RGYNNDTYVVAAESAPFTVSNAPVLTTDASSYASDGTVHVTYSGMSGNVYDWISLTAANSPSTSFASYFYVNAATSGTGDFAVAAVAVTACSYVGRAYFNNSYFVESESAPFTVAAPTGGTATITTDAQSYPANGSAQINFSGMSGATDDWISIAPALSSQYTY